MSVFATPVPNRTGFAADLSVYRHVIESVCVDLIFKGDLEAADEARPPSPAGGLEIKPHSVEQLSGRDTFQVRFVSDHPGIPGKQSNVVNSGDGTGNLRDLRDSASRDVRRWITELDLTSPRQTLSVGILQQACRHAENLLRQSAEVYLPPTSPLLPIGLNAITNGRKKTIAKLTFGECGQLLIFADSKKALQKGRHLIRKADRSLIDRLTRARNDFAHDTPVARIDGSFMLTFLSDVLSLTRTSVVECAVARTVE